ncbi:unnamed protein product, partial [Didymodactylos carnosus]
NFLFAYSGECLTKRLRSNAFLIILQQELGWFDKQENNTGALCKMLASDAAEIQSLAIGSIQNIRTIKQLTKENEFGNQFCSMLNKSLQSSVGKNFHLLAILYAVETSVIFFITPVVFYAAVYLIQSNQIKPENVIM